MWKRDAESQPDQPQPAASGPARTAVREAAPASKPTSPGGLATIGRSVVIKGELTGGEDFQIDGTVEGTIDLEEHVLTIGPSASINAEIRAKSVVVLGKVRGNITAVERIELSENGSVEGDIVAPSVAMAEGSHFRGSIDMQGSRKSAAAPAPRPAATSTSPVNTKPSPAVAAG